MRPSRFSRPQTSRTTSRPSLLLFTAALLAMPGVLSAALPSRVTAAPDSTARVLPIAGDAFAGSSVNMISGLQNTLFTDRGHQFAAFYAADSTLVLARRKLGQDTWETARTQYTGNVRDAHNTVALVVDGDGWLHVAWNHHGNPLNYCRSIAPGSLELGPKQPMTGELETNVTYPVFHRLPDGNLLFLYRDGRSGRGNLVLNRYETKTTTWSPVHKNLIDGEGQRSAYPSTHIDRKGVLHLAWTWRDTPDVASNHDLCYAKSEDAGKTWTTSAGAPLPLPLNAANAEYVLRIPTNSALMNPPSLAVDDEGRACIVNYWRPAGSDIPQYHLLRHDGTAWQLSQITQRTTPFVLAGTATKRPPISRSVIFTVKGWRKPQEIYLVFRDDERGGRIVLAACNDINAAKPDWRIRDLTTDSVGAWEPSLDIVQAHRLKQLHLLVQPVDQRDGNDREAASIPPTTISSLIWSPFIAGMTEKAFAPPPTPPAASLDRPLVATGILSLLQRVTDWQLAQPYHKNRDPRGWEIAPFYMGTLAVARISPDAKYHDAMLAHFETLKWEPAARVYDADDYCITQAYLQLYRQHRDPKMLAPSKARLDAILAKPSSAPLEWGWPGSRDRWSWCDALFMGPASWLMMAEATGDARYADFANREWWVTTEALYSKAERLFARDESFVDLREPNGRPLFWSRGNGWVVAGLSHVLAILPKNHRDYPRYLSLYRDMMEATLATQQPDGLWRPGLLDPVTHSAQETSGSAFMAYALAYGINEGLLDRARAEPAVRRAWNALTACVAESGKVEHIQPIGSAPEGFDPQHNDWYGVGAFLLAGSEIHRVARSPVPAK